ncbi:hypothetical protein Tco_0612664 [Tanacetum coccineum]
MAKRKENGEEQGNGNVKESMVARKQVNQDEEGFVQIRNQKKQGMGQNKGKEFGKNNKAVNMKFRPKIITEKNNEKNKEKTSDTNKVNVTDEGSKQNEKEKTQSPNNKGNGQKDVIKEIGRSANKFAVFKEIEEGKINEELSKESRETVDVFIQEKVQPTFEDTKNWSQEMRSSAGMAQQMIANELDGIAKCVTENNLGELGDRLWNLDSSKWKEAEKLLKNLNFSK